MPAFTIRDHIKQVQAGGPGSGRHPEAGTFKQLHSEVSKPLGKAEMRSEYESKGGHRVHVIEHREQWNKIPGVKSGGRVTRVGMAINELTPRKGSPGVLDSKQVFSGDGKAGQQFLNNRYEIQHKGLAVRGQ